MKTTNQYHEQSEQFLAKHGIKFRATLSDSKVAPWKSANERSEHHYRVTLSQSGKRIAFDFWGSIADAEKGLTDVPAYDVLACISADVYCPDNFKDFCEEFGYEEDSIKALQTFRRCHAFAKRLRAFFTDAEISDLVKIQ